MKRIFRITKFVIYYVASVVCAFFIKLFSKSSRNIWIISERGDDARDNGYFFYKYIREKHKEINIYYIISRNSCDYGKVASIGKTVEYGSFRHYVFYSLCKIRICSSMYGGDLPNAYYFEKYKRILNKKKFIYLCHGVEKDYDETMFYEVFKPSIITTGTIDETNFLINTYGYPSGTVQYTGLARFDTLHNTVAKNQILIMPTFRRWLQGKTKSEKKKSEYFQEWNSIINDSKLIDVLEKNDIVLVFYLHYVFQNDTDLFKTKSNNIVIAKKEDYDVQKLLNESSLLVTDFSSVFFDFAYMKKPIVYYQFDVEKYVNEHYDFRHGYFSYEKNGFGDVIYNKEELINSIINHINSKFIVEDKYIDRVEKTFILNDNNNCKRIYDAIIQYDKKSN